MYLDHAAHDGDLRSSWIFAQSQSGPTTVISRIQLVSGISWIDRHRFFARIHNTIPFVERPGTYDAWWR